MVEGGGCVSKYASAEKVVGRVSILSGYVLTRVLRVEGYKRESEQRASGE